jgi:uncharacterized protein (TIGR02246 family)
MQRNRALVTLALAALAAAAASPALADGAAAGISAASAAWMKAVEAKDAVAVAALYTEEAQVLPPNMGPLVGREAIAAFFAQAFQMGVSSIGLATQEVFEMGDWAVEVGTYTVDVGGTEVDRGKSLVLWRKEGDGWRLHRDTWNSSLPAAAAVVEGAAPGMGG